MTPEPQGVRKLVRYSARVGVKNSSGKTPLHFSLETGKLKVTSFLLSKGADINESGGGQNLRVESYLCSQQQFNVGMFFILVHLHY